MSIFNL